MVTCLATSTSFYIIHRNVVVLYSKESRCPVLACISAHSAILMNMCGYMPLCSYCLSISDDCPPDMCIPGDVKAFTEFGFDNLKIDGCSAQRDVAQWATLINKSGVYSEIGMYACMYVRVSGVCVYA